MLAKELLTNILKFSAYIVDLSALKVMYSTLRGNFSINFKAQVWLLIKLLTEPARLCIFPRQYQ